MLHCSHHSNERITLLDKIRDVNEDILNQNDKLLVRTLIFGDRRLFKFNNIEIVNSSIE